MVKNKAIRAARDWFREKGEAGWMKGPDWMPFATHRCIMSACYDAFEGDFVAARDTIHRLIYGCDYESGATVRGPAAWNDDPARTFPEVLAVVEAADLALNGGEE